MRPVWPHLVPSTAWLLNLWTRAGSSLAWQSRLQGEPGCSAPSQSWPPPSSPGTLLKAAHCSSLRPRSDWGQGERTQERQAWEDPSHPRLSRQTLRLVCKPSEPQVREHRDHGDQGDHRESVVAREGEGRTRPRLRPSI